MDSCRQSRSWNAKANVHSSWFPSHGRTMDAKSCLISQIEADKQHLRQTRPCEFIYLSLLNFDTVALGCPISFSYVKNKLNLRGGAQNFRSNRYSEVNSGLKQTTPNLEKFICKISWAPYTQFDLYRVIKQTIEETYMAFFIVFVFVPDDPQLNAQIPTKVPLGTC